MLELAIGRNAEEREREQRCCGGQEEERSGNIIAFIIHLSVAARHFRYFFARCSFTPLLHAVLLQLLGS